MSTNQAQNWFGQAYDKNNPSGDFINVSSHFVFSSVDRFSSVSFYDLREQN